MWISDIESMIFTRIKKNIGEHLKNKYPNIFFTSSDKNEFEPKFPTVLIRDIGGIEKGIDLENNNINAYQCTIQVDVIDNVSQSRAKEVMRYVVDEMKKLRFSVAISPHSDNKADAYRSVARFKREVGWNDIL